MELYGDVRDLIDPSLWQCIDRNSSEVQPMMRTTAMLRKHCEKGNPTNEEE